MPTGPIINQFHKLSVSNCGNNLSGLISAEYSLSRNINSLYSLGNRNSIATYGDMPEIQVSYTGHAPEMGSFSASDANLLSTISIHGSNGGVSASLALLSKFSYNFQTDGPFTITKSYTGFAKPSAGGGGGGGGGGYGSVKTAKRADYSGALPPGISGNYLTGVTAEISINRQNIGEFATRKPYASVLQFPLQQSITYEVIASSMDSITIEDLYMACKNPGSQTYSAGINACGASFSISKAYVTNIQYNGGEASLGSKPQTISITYTSYEDIPGIKPIIYFDDQQC